MIARDLSCIHCFHQYRWNDNTPVQCIAQSGFVSKADFHTKPNVPYLRLGIFGAFGFSIITFKWVV